MNECRNVRLNCALKAVAFVVLSFMISLILIVFTNTVEAESSRDVRTGGIYDKLMILRPGIDDVGATLGYFLSCLEKSIESTVASGTRTNIKRDIEIEESRNSVTVILPGLETNELHFEFVIGDNYVLLETITIVYSSVYTPNESTSSFNVKYQLVGAFSQYC